MVNSCQEKIIGGNDHEAAVRKPLGGRLQEDWQSMRNRGLGRRAWPGRILRPAGGSGGISSMLPTLASSRFACANPQDPTMEQRGGSLLQAQ
jgi:hypothetical protein